MSVVTLKNDKSMKMIEESILCAMDEEGEYLYPDGRIDQVVSLIPEPFITHIISWEVSYNYHASCFESLNNGDK